MPKAFHAGACAPALLLAVCAASAHAQTTEQISPLLVQGERPASSAPASPATTETLYAGDLRTSVNQTNTEDALKYFPSLLVRKRHIGDTQAPLATRTSGLGASARSLIYVDGVLLSALIGNNNSFASPRWGMVAPQEIVRVDVLYGPFSAAYPGNSAGAVVNFTTRMPDSPTASLTAAVSRQSFSQYGVRGDYPARQIQGEIGDRQGRLSWNLGGDHVESQSHPLSYATLTPPASPSLSGTPVSGAYEARNRLGAPIVMVGAGGLEDQTQDTLKAKLRFDLTPSLTLAYTAGLFLNDTQASAQSFLRDTSGAPLYSGALNIGGYAYSAPASLMSNGVYRLEERHWLHALTLKGETGGVDWRAVISRYDYDRSRQRAPSGALPAALAGGAGSLTRMDGTGWETADLSADWKAAQDHDLSLGLHADHYVLANNRFNLADWLSGTPGALASASRGRTITQALWAQDAWSLSPDLTLTLGGRYEDWRAYGGLNYSASPALNVSQPDLSARRFSPKASLAWRGEGGWSVTASLAKAYRFPTVSELYQAVTTGATLSTPNPNLRPEAARSGELAILRQDEKGQARVSVFIEDMKDALISQTALLNGASVGFVQNIDEVRTRGIELSFERRDVLLKGLSLSGAYTLADPVVVRNAALPASIGKDAPGVPRNRATLTAVYRPNSAWSFSLAGRYADRSYATIDNSDRVTNTYQGFEKFLVLDARAVWRAAPGWSLAAGVDNLTNQDYFLFHPFPQRTASLELQYSR